MRLTPLDIRKQEFKKGMRGLDSDEVYAFLSTVADEYEAVLNDNKALRERLLELDDKVQEYRNMEKTLRDTLLTAERITVDAKENARREANLIIKQAELEADRGARDIKENALKLRQEIQSLKRQRESYIARMRMIVESHLKFLESAEQDFADEESRMETYEKERSTRVQKGNVPPRATETGGAKRSPAAKLRADSDLSESSMSPPLDSPVSPLDRPLPDGPSADARSKADAGLPGATAVMSDRRPSHDLDRLVEHASERKREAVGTDGQNDAVASPNRVAKPRRDGEETTSPVEPRGDADGDNASPADEPSEWSLERLKRDILSRRSKK